MRVGTALAAALAVLAYAAASHWLMLHAAKQPWAVAVIIGPLLLTLAGAAWQRRHWPSLWVCALAAAVIAVLTARGTLQDVHRLYVLQYVAIHLCLGGVFAFTLRRGSTPLITRLASWVHDDFTPLMRAYTARLTRLWVLYFVVMAAAGIALYLLAPWAWWSLYANLLTPLALAAFFVGEYLLRYQLHPEFERASMKQALRAYRRMQGNEAAR